MSPIREHDPGAAVVTNESNDDLEATNANVLPKSNVIVPEIVDLRAQMNKDGSGDMAKGDPSLLTQRVTLADADEEEPARVCLMTCKAIVYLVAIALFAVTTAFTFVSGNYATATTGVQVDSVST